MRRNWITILCSVLLPFDTLVFLSDAQANIENITAKDILQSTLETVTSRPPMMAGGEVHGKWTDSVEGIREVKYVSRVYIKNQQHDTTRDSWYLKDGKWTKSAEHRGIWDGSRYTLRERKMPSYTASGDLWPGDFYVVYRDKPHTVEWGMRTYSLTGTTRDEHFAKLLLESETLRLRPEMEQVDGFDCYVVEGDTPSYYHTVWIDPQNGYLHRKIICEGYQKNLPYEGSWIIKSGIEVTDVKIEYFEGIPVVTEAKRHFFNERTDGNTLDATCQEKMSNVVWNPDFESMGAFKMDKVPDGTRVIYKVNDLYKTGVKFHWQGGRIVPNVDESRSFPTLVFVLIGLSIIAIIAWRVFLVKGRQP